MLLQLQALNGFAALVQGAPDAEVPEDGAGAHPLLGSFSS